MVHAVVSAPGKLVILGEYAVLANAPALVMAVDRRCRAEIRPSGNALCFLESKAEAEREVIFRCQARSGLGTGGSGYRSVSGPRRRRVAGLHRLQRPFS